MRWCGHDVTATLLAGLTLLKAHLPEADHRWVHRGLTSQDVMDTGLALVLKDGLQLLAERLGRLTDALGVLSARDGARSLMGVTRMQAALPMTTADRVASWTRPLLALSEQLPPLAGRAAVLQWGGPVGVRDPALPEDTGARFATTLGLRDPGTAWHNDRGRLAEVAGALSRITGATGKIGQDIALLSQVGPEALHRTGGGGSSAMPHKENPILAELLVTLARRNASDLSLMHQAMIHEQERSGAAWTLEWMVLPQMLMATGRSLVAAHDAVHSITRLGQAG